jgi:hypothetical protein
VDITSHPGRPLAPNVQRFAQELSQLETLVMQGLATTIEQVVYHTASHAARYARDDEELWHMLAQCQEHVVAFAAGNRFPPEYYQSYAYAGLRYQKLMDTLPPYDPGREQMTGETGKIGRKKRKGAVKK